MYNYNYPYIRKGGYYEDRFGGFLVPFLLGGLGGSAIVGLSRPRPVMYTPNPNYQQYNYPYYY